ncbi:LacI family DNA-binding transcriptional regulator [Fodinibius halophilus]|uniref:LacI family transcriptional regulator n=1 Tax=Fodinibius halophilus TaxID=1736908 RepID=A0A6M1T8K3_9BACT|nr:LacI family DNA-binding transcriptional regulator [Fodinibius halophilus]NGP88361.1 LacI family transcriptional regulator [Fodinibius halophilus]
MKKLSIDQVAELAYVSRSVVSRVLNNHKNVSDEARERVMKVVEEHNYQPSSVARGLATNKNYEIGIVAPRRCDETLGNGFWSLLHLGIFEECIDNGYFVTLSPISTDKGSDINENILDDKRLDGYILLTQEVTDFVINKLKEQDVPMVVVGHDEQNHEITSIDVNNFAGVKKSTNHLIDLGHKRIGAIMASPNMKESVDRINGYKEALNEANLPISEEYIAVDDYSQRHGYNTMKKWIKNGLDITGVVCMSDTLAMGALLALHEEDISVPEKFSVVGFDDLPIAQYTIPPLTTVQQPIYEKGKRAANLLVNQIENKDADIVHENLEAELVVRQSSDIAPQ